MLNFLLLMGASGGGSGKSSNPIVAFLPFIVLILIMYFLMIRPQAKRQKEQKAMISSLEKGDKILTSGGIVCTVAGFREKDNVLIVKIADGIKIELSRNSVGQVLKKKSEKA